MENKKLHEILASINRMWIIFMKAVPASEEKLSRQFVEEKNNARAILDDLMEG